jgi:hypothetical protein
LNAIALSWVTAGSYSPSNATLDRFSLPTLDVSPLTLAQTDRERGKEPHYPGTTTLQTALHEVPSPLPESFYDYIPRDQVSQPQLPQPQRPRIDVSKVKVTTPSGNTADINSDCSIGSEV